MGTRQAQIRSDLQTVGQILAADSRYKVSIHQRDFSWTLEEVMQLWDDITDSIIEDRREYFLGTVVVQESREVKTSVIIDGQQRLATLSMLRSEIRTVYTEYDDFLLELEEFIRDRIILILVSVGDEADAYLIFETLNDRGLELSIVIYSRIISSVEREIVSI